MNSPIVIYINDEPYTVDRVPMSGTEIAMLAHDEHHADYDVYLFGENAAPSRIETCELVAIYDRDRFVTTRKEG